MSENDEHTPLQRAHSPPPSAPSSSNTSRTNRTANKGCLLRFLTVLSVFIIISGLGIICLQAGSMYLLATKISLVRAGLQLYIVIFSVIIILNEMEWTALVRNSLVSYSWIARGLFYIFIGLILLDQQLGYRTGSQFVGLCSVLFGHSLVFSGLIYLIMGLLCLKRMRDDRMARYVQLLSYMEVQDTIRNGGIESYVDKV